MELKLTLPVPVSINKLYINEYRFNPVTRRREPTGARILSKEGEKSKQAIQEAAKEQLKDQSWDYEWTEDKNNFLYQDAIIYFSRRGRDDNNVYKLLNDSLEGIVYDNDSRVLVRTQKILFDKDNPRMELTLVPVDYVGIFNSEDEYIEFESNCQSCTRFRNGRCSILSDSYNGTVREEVDLNSYECSEYKKKST